MFMRGGVMVNTERVVLYKLCFEDLSSILNMYQVMFLHGYSKMTVFTNESSLTKLIPPQDVRNVAALPYQICTWLSKMRDPSFRWESARLEHHNVCVETTQPEQRTTVIQHSNPCAVALGKVVSAGKVARQTVDHANLAQDLYWQHFLLGIGFEEACSFVEVEKRQKVPAEAKKIEKSHLALLQTCMKTVQSVSTSVLALEEARDHYLKAPTHKAHAQRDLMKCLEALCEKSILYSSSFWTLGGKK